MNMPAKHGIARSASHVSLYCAPGHVGELSETRLTERAATAAAAPMAVVRCCRQVNQSIRDIRSAS